MGITIRSKNHSCDMGPGGFLRFQETVAKQISPEFSVEFEKFREQLRQAYFNKKNKQQIIDAHQKYIDECLIDGLISEAVIQLLYQPDTEGKIKKKNANKIYKLIKDLDDTTKYGYIGRADCATMKDLKQIFGDKSKVKWY